MDSEQIHLIWFPSGHAAKFYFIACYNECPLLENGSVMEVGEWVRTATGVKLLMSGVPPNPHFCDFYEVLITWLMITNPCLSIKIKVVAKFNKVEIGRNFRSCAPRPVIYLFISAPRNPQKANLNRWKMHSVWFDGLDFKVSAHSFAVIIQSRSCRGGKIHPLRGM